MMTLLLNARSWRVLHYLITGGALIAWTLCLSLLAWGKRFYRRLADERYSPGEPLPSLSILVPACNEGETVERAMLSLLALDYPNLEIIAIDDRSVDDTGAILDRLAADHPRLRVRHITQLPRGWLGKNHALQVASEEASGQWLLFTDADVVFAPDTLRRAVSYACHHNLDHLVLSPRCETHGFWERLFVSHFSLMFAFWVRPWQVADPNKAAYAGLGAFNLVRAAAYRHFGGHRALPMDVVDDTKLGKVIKRSGFRQELMEGGDLISVRWVVGLRGVVDGLTKNAFAGFDYKLLLEMSAILGLLTSSVYPAVALFLPGTATRLMAAATMLLMTLGAGEVRRISGANAAYGLAYPLADLIFVYIILRSTWRTYRQRGILWRGTLYPLDELRKGVV